MPRSQDLPKERLREKTNTKLSKNQNFSANVLKKRKRITNIDHSEGFMKIYIAQQTKQQSKNANLCLNEYARTFSSHKSSKEHRNKSYDYEDNNKYTQKTKFQKESASNLNHKLFHENFIQDPLNVFYKPIGTINIRKQDKISKGTKFTKYPKIFLKKYEKSWSRSHKTNI